MIREATTTMAPFIIKDCALIALATGKRVQNLKELRDHLEVVPHSSLYYHFWGGLLHPGFEEREYGNDLGEWAKHGLHDASLAERLAVIDPSSFDDTEDMRQALLDVVEQRLEEASADLWRPADRHFQFIRSQIVVFGTGRSVLQPEQLAEVIPDLSPGSVFYHFIDARQRSPRGEDDFRAWLSPEGERYAGLCQGLASIDPYFASLHELREQLAALFSEFHGRSTHVKPA
ncbi:DUF5752 family protein [Marinobacter sp. HL-58]|uniref:DUF5752 family protein n=1 Tax=Marinobacter sp. HL-58 TaxID=1479237 RepID=UPI0004838C85|nr:DUF5752 family protein [Marinobacter sp. HL-58]KPP98887.1 MAG: hypothetical protein HLUCCO03_13720 [Marinobacter sp. HL-58]